MLYAGFSKIGWGAVDYKLLILKHNIMGNDEDRVQTQIDAGIHEKEVIINFLQTNPKGRLLFNSIAFQIANYFKTHPEKITHELVCGIIRAVKQTKIK